MTNFSHWVDSQIDCGIGADTKFQKAFNSDKFRVIQGTTPTMSTNGALAVGGPPNTFYSPLNRPHWKAAREIIYETDMVVEGDKFNIHYKAVPMQ